MIIEGYLLKKIIVLTYICALFTLTSIVSSNGFSASVIYFNRNATAEKLSFILIHLTGEDADINFLHSFNNNFSTCRYYKYRSIEMHLNNKLTTNFNTILIIPISHTIKFNFVLFPLRC